MGLSAHKFICPIPTSQSYRRTSRRRPLSGKHADPPNYPRFSKCGAASAFVPMRPVRPIRVSICCGFWHGGAEPACRRKIEMSPGAQSRNDTPCGGRDHSTHAARLRIVFDYLIALLDRESADQTRPASALLGIVPGRLAALGNRRQFSAACAPAPPIF
jgi:hypothetical protein